MQQQRGQRLAWISIYSVLLRQLQEGAGLNPPYYYVLFHMWWSPQPTAVLNVLQYYVLISIEAEPNILHSHRVILRVMFLDDHDFSVLIHAGVTFLFLSTCVANNRCSFQPNHVATYKLTLM